MHAPLAFPRMAAVRNPRVKMGKKARKTRHSVGLESLENRVVLSYTFSYNPGTMVATAVGTMATDSLVIEPVSGLLEYSVNGGALSSNWGGQTVGAQSDVTVNIDVSSGDGSSLQLGAPSGAASQLRALIGATVPTNSSDTLTIDDSASTAASTYSVNTGSGDITGPGFSYHEVGPFAGGITLKGGSGPTHATFSRPLRPSHSLSPRAHPRRTSRTSATRAGSMAFWVMSRSATPSVSQPSILTPRPTRRVTTPSWREPRPPSSAALRRQTSSTPLPISAASR